MTSPRHDGCVRSRRPRRAVGLRRERRRHPVDEQPADHAQPDRQPGQVGRRRRRRSPRASPRRGRRRRSSSSSQAAIRAGAGSSGEVAGEHLGGELGVHGVQVVAQRGPGHRLPAVLARQREDPLHQQRAARAARRARSAPGRPRRGSRLVAGRRSRRCRAACTPGGSTATRVARSSGTPCSTSAVAALDERRRARGRSSARAAAAITCCTGSLKKSTVPWLSSGGRRLVTSQREARSTRVRISSRIRVCTAGVELVVVGRRARSRSGSEPKISRATKLARVSSAAVAPVSPASRGQKVMPAPLTRSLTTWVTMISRRSGCVAPSGRGSPAASASGSRRTGRGRRNGSSGRSVASSSSASTILV